MKTGIFCMGLILLLAVGADAQWTDDDPLDSQRNGAQRGVAVHGQISSDNVFLGSLTVELVANGHSVVQSTSLGADGSFDFRSVAPGVYDLRLTGTGGSVVHEERVIVNGPNQFLSINMRTRGSADRSAATVSIRQLQHKVPSEAQKEYSKGQAAARKGDDETALQHFQKATGIDPEFADAYCNLGTAELALGQLEKAAEQFQKAIDLVPDHTLAVTNLSIALCRLDRYKEAGQAARQALKLNPGLLRMRYVLALSLTKEQGHEAEALDNLERAAAEIPKARLLAADILTHTGKPEDAAKQLEQYLHVSPERDTDRKKVEEWLAQLRRP